MKYLWRIHLWFMAGCKPSASVSTSVCDHKMAVQCCHHPQTCWTWSLLSDVWEDWCHITVTTSWLMPPVASPQEAGPQRKLIVRAELECGPRHNGISGHNVWQSKSKNWHHLSLWAVYLNISLESLSCGPDMYTPGQTLSWYRVRILTILIAAIICLIINYPGLKAVSLQTRNFQTQYCELAPI